MTDLELVFGKVTRIGTRNYRVEWRGVMYEITTHICSDAVTVTLPNGSEKHYASVFAFTGDPAPEVPDDEFEFNLEIPDNGVSDWADFLVEPDLQF